MVSIRPLSYGSLCNLTQHIHVMSMSPMVCGAQKQWAPVLTQLWPILWPHSVASFWRAKSRLAWATCPFKLMKQCLMEEKKSSRSDTLQCSHSLLFMFDRWFLYMYRRWAAATCRLNVAQPPWVCVPWTRVLGLPLLPRTTLYYFEVCWCVQIDTSVLLGISVMCLEAGTLCQYSMLQRWREGFS